MLIKFNTLTKLCEDITIGLGVKPTKHFDELIDDNEEVRVYIYEDVGCLRVDIERSDDFLEDYPNSYQWNLVDAFCTPDDYRFMESMNKHCHMSEEAHEENVNKAILLCEEFGKNGVTNRLAYWALHVMSNAEDLFSDMNAANTLCHITKESNVFDAYTALLQLERGLGIRNMLLEYFPKKPQWFLGATAQLFKAYSKDSQYTFDIIIDIIISDTNGRDITFGRTIRLLLDTDPNNKDRYMVRREKQC